MTSSCHRRPHLVACHCCGQIHSIPGGTECEADTVGDTSSDRRTLDASAHGTQLEQPRASDWECVRCCSRLHLAGSELAPQRTAAAAVGALILYVPAICLPLLEIQRLGFRHSTSLLHGTWELFTHGTWFVGLVVLLFSLILPLAKILLLLELSWLGLTQRHHRAWSYRAMEFVGRWSMLDVLLLALLVMLVKLGNVIEFQIGPAVVAFVFCVALSLIAAICFDPSAIWDDMP